MSRRLTPMGMGARALCKHMHNLDICNTWDALTSKEKTRLMKLAKTVLQATAHHELRKLVMHCPICESKFTKLLEENDG